MSKPLQEADWVETPAQLRELLSHVRNAGRMAFDTEFVSEDTFEPILCLIQVATTEKLAVLDPIEIPDLDPFWDLFNDPEIEVITHAAGEDLRIARLRTGKLPERIVDVQLAAALAGHGYPISLSNLIRMELGVSLSGGETRTDWRKRPLSEAQVQYALDDVRYLLELAEVLSARLESRNRLDWAEAEYQRLLDSVIARGDDEERWRRLPGLHQLNRRGLEAARRLAQWRIEQARVSNRPIRQIIRDDLLVAIAKRMPENKRDLEALREFNRPHLLSRANQVLDVLAEARGVPADELPRPQERREEAPGLSMVVSMLAASLNQCCAAEGVSASLVGSTGDLRDLVSWHIEGRDEAQRPALARGWRSQLCGNVLEDVLSGRRSLRIVDPSAEVPVLIEDLEPRPKA